MTIKEIQDEIVEDFSAFDDWMDKYSYLIELGGDLQPIPEVYKKEENIIKGCQSKVWLHAEYKDGLVHYVAFSDALIVKGMIALLLKVFSKQTPQAILAANTDFISEIGLDEHYHQLVPMVCLLWLSK